MFNASPSPRSNLHDRLRHLRIARGLRQSDLATLLGYSQATVSNVERGERQLDVIELHQWLKALGGNFMEFVGQLDSELRGREARVTRVPRATTRGRLGSPKHAALRAILSVSDLAQRALTSRYETSD